ncbi:MAG: NADH-quinone oxidoreductase subunit J [Candidatus Brocadiaceae bacterium]|nr:NADH-quinone oxidoreductase subunit J [Candidatus Brocadiaceae bacterium]
MDAYLFYIMATASVFAAIYLVFEKNPVFSALYLVFVMLNIAVLYIMLHAQFIAAVQIIIYTGAIMVLFLFVIMLLKIDQKKPKDVLSFLKSPSIFLGILLLITICLVLKSKVPAGKQGEYTAEKIEAIGHTKLVGNLLFTDYLLPFEITSILLFVAVIGAIILAKRKI